MQQQTVFPVLSVQTSEQAALAKDLAIITNILGLKVIEIEQRDVRLRQFEGMMVCKYKEIPQSDEQLMAPGSTMGHTEQQRYPYEIVGGTVRFVQNPYARRPLGTGRVAFLIDDNLPLPPGAMSGAKTGWNREALASNMNDPLSCNFWHIVDDDIRQEIAARAAAIKANMEKAKKEKEATEKAESSAGTLEVEPSKALPAFADETQNVGGASDPAIGRVIETTTEAKTNTEELFGTTTTSIDTTPLSSADENNRKFAALIDKLNQALVRISALESENGALRTQNEELTRMTRKPRRGRPPRAKMTSSFAGQNKD